jgi:predicted transcriptional regulator
MVNPVQAVDEMASRGLSGRAIAKTVGVSEATVRRILRSGRGNSSTMDGDAVRAPIARNPVARGSMGACGSEEA